jgi:hypothetical protein
MPSTEAAFTGLPANCNAWASLGAWSFRRVAGHAAAGRRVHWARQPGRWGRAPSGTRGRCRSPARRSPAREGTDLKLGRHVIGRAVDRHHAREDDLPQSHRPQIGRIGADQDDEVGPGAVAPQD